MVLIMSICWRVIASGRTGGVGEPLLSRGSRSGGTRGPLSSRLESSMSVSVRRSTSSVPARIARETFQLSLLLGPRVLCLH